MKTYRINDWFEFSFNTQDRGTAVATDADALPTYRVYEEGNDTVIASGSCGKRDDDNTTGYYVARGAITAAAGYEVGKFYDVRVVATVNGVTGASPVGSFLVASDNVWNSLIGATDLLDTNADEISGDATAAGNLEAILDGTGGVTLGYFTIRSTAAGQPGLKVIATDTASAVVLTGAGIGYYSMDVSGGGIYNPFSATPNILGGYESDIYTNTNTLITTLNTVAARIGTWTGTGINTLLGAFKALFSKTAAAPSDIGGTFTPTTDSVEAIRDSMFLAASYATPPTASAIASQVETTLSAAHGSGSWDTATTINIATTETSVRTSDG